MHIDYTHQYVIDIYIDTLGTGGKIEVHKDTGFIYPNVSYYKPVNVDEIRKLQDALNEAVKLSNEITEAPEEGASDGR